MAHSALKPQTLLPFSRLRSKPLCRTTVKPFAKLSNKHGSSLFGGPDSLSQQFKGYLEFLQRDDDGQKPLETPTWAPEEFFQTLGSVETDAGSETEAEIAEVENIVANLTEANNDLQSDMEKLVQRLGDLIENIKITSASDKALLAVLPEGGNGATVTARAADTLIPPLPAASAAVDTNPVDTTVNCVIQHPGALCCTRATVTEAPANVEFGRSVTLSLETTVRATDTAPNSHSSALTSEELGGLAAQAMLAAAAEHLSSRTRAINTAARPVEDRQIHEELTAILQDGDIVEAIANPVVSQFGHESFMVTLQDHHHHPGRRLKAIFKPRVQGEADGWHRAPMEMVAYRLNLLLGLDHIPPVAYRSGGINFKLTGGDHDVGKDVFYPEGAFMLFVEDARELRCFPENEWGTPVPENKDLLLSNTRILDVLLHNSDRHHGHFLLARHWCRGTWEEKEGGGGSKWKGDFRPCLIDHAASFRADAEVTMLHENSFKTGPVRCVSAKTYMRLRFLDYTTLQEQFRDVLSEEELRGLVKRRDAVLFYLDRLVAEQGYAATVME